MKKEENKKFFIGVFLGSIATAVLLASATMHQFGTVILEGESTFQAQTTGLAQAKTDPVAIPYPWSNPLLNVGKTTSIGKDSYLILQEMRSIKTGKTVRLLVENNEINREHFQAAIEEGYVTRLQCINGKDWFGNKGENKGGPVLLTIWDRAGERLLGYNKTAMEEVNAYTGCVRMRKWQQDRVMFEVADLRHAQLQVYYYAYDFEATRVDLVYAYESYAIEGGFMYTWIDSSRQHTLVQQVTGEDQATDLYRVPYIEMEDLLERPSRLHSYPLALDTSLPIRMSLLEDQRILGAEKGLVVTVGGENSLVEWSVE
jgi:hypothetical protein